MKVMDILVLISVGANLFDWLFARHLGLVQVPHLGFLRHIFWAWTFLLGVSALLHLVRVLPDIYFAVVGVAYVMFLQWYSIAVRHQHAKSVL